MVSTSGIKPRTGNAMVRANAVDGETRREVQRKLFAPRNCAHVNPQSP